jgi:hypothetical protein
MTRQHLALFVLALVAIACQQAVIVPAASPTPSATAPVPTATAKPTEASVPAQDVQTATIRATVYVRAEPDANSAEIGSLATGAEVEIVSCLSDWCEIRTDVLSGYVWRGCTSDNPDGLKCEARP